MTFPELQIQFDLSPDNRINVLKNVDICKQIKIGYLFVNSEDGQCYLFDENGNLDDISKVKSIENWAFGCCISLASILIPDSVKSIGDWAFYGCKSLTSISIPDSVKGIGYRAFYNCTSLTNIEIPDSIKSIGFNAFYNCTSLKEVIFKGKTIGQVKAMQWYPWGIEDESVIKIENEQKSRILI